MGRLVEEENRELEDSAWRKETASVVGVKCLEKVKVEVAGDEEAATDAMLRRIGWRLCCWGRSFVSWRMFMMAEMELGEMMRLWVEEQAKGHRSRASDFGE